MSAVVESRKRLEETLNCIEFSSFSNLHDFLESRLENEISLSSSALELKTQHAWSFLEEMRSASGEKPHHFWKHEKHDHHHAVKKHDREWKQKEDKGSFRVLYRKGPDMTPIHTICLDGLLEGPMVTSFYVAREASQYKDWWPHVHFPTFKVLESNFVSQTQTATDIAYILARLPWPLKERDLCLHCCTYVHEERETIITTIRPGEVVTIPVGSERLEGDDWANHKEGIVRMSVVGGYAMQKIAPNKTYFRAIYNVDFKFDFIPPPVLNFLSRQLAGIGFEFFQKVVKDVEKKLANGEVGAVQKAIESERVYSEISKAMKKSV